MTSVPLPITYEPEELATSPIQLAVAQVQYPTTMSVPTNETLLAAFQDRIRDVYPFLSIGQQVGFTISQQNVEQQNMPRVFQFTDASQQWTVSLSADSLALETRVYTTFSEFSNRLLKVLADAKEVYSLGVRRRLGLRYVNEIRREDQQETRTAKALWDSVIRQDLLGVLSTEVGDSLDQTFQELSVTIENGKLIMRHGAFSQGTAVAPLPSQPVQDGPFYLLDFDAFHDQPADLDVKSISKILRDYNRNIFTLFRWSLCEEYYDILRGR